MIDAPATCPRRFGSATSRRAGRSGHVVTLAIALSGTASSFAQTPDPLPPPVRESLNSIEDFSLSFSQPGFYALLEHVASIDNLGDDAQPATDWRELLERPAEFRGRLITVEGVVGRNSAWTLQHEDYRKLGTIWQLELHRANQPIACTLILTEDATDIPLGATIRATGYFAMIRQYYSRTNQLRQAMLVVGHGPTEVVSSAALARQSAGSFWLSAALAGTLALVIVWLLVRRSTSPARVPQHELRAAHAAPLSLADDLAKWAEDDVQQCRDTEDRL